MNSLDSFEIRSLVTKAVEFVEIKTMKNESRWQKMLNFRKIEIRTAVLSVPHISVVQYGK